VGDIVEERTMWKYRVVEKTWNSSSSLSGWTQTGEKHYSDWTSGGTTNTKPEESDTLKITGTSTTYHYHHYVRKDQSGKYQCYGSGGGIYDSISLSYELSWNGSYYTGPACSGAAGCSGWIAWWSDGTTTTYSYDIRSITEYEYTRTSDWKLADSDPSGEGIIDVYSWKQYRSKNKIYGTKYTYWGSFSGWQDTDPGSSSTRDVEKVVSYYRYKLK